MHVSMYTLNYAHTVHNYVIHLDPVNYCIHNILTLLRY